MEKVKSNFILSITRIIKSSLLAVCITLVGVVLLAVLLKFIDLSSSAIEWGNNLIKVVALFFMVLSIKKSQESKLLIKSVFGGAIYAVLCNLIFSILNGQISFGFNFVYDMLFAAIASVILSIVINLFQRRAV